MALALQGYSGALAQALGSLHWHLRSESTVVSPPLWEQALATLQDWHVRAQVAQHLLNQLHAEHDPPQGSTPELRLEHRHAHQHEHGRWERHHHDATDASVVSLDSASPLLAEDALSTLAATGGWVAVPHLLDMALCLPVPPSQAIRWPLLAPPHWRNAPLAHPERPPQA